jgi:hypothetical protein
MAYLGLVSSEHSTGTSRHQGPITKSGNTHARWFLIECAQHYALPPKVSKELSKRQEHQPQRIKELSWKTQIRLHRRFWALMQRGICRQIAVVAVRENYAALSGRFCARRQDRSSAALDNPMNSDNLTKGKQNERHTTITLTKSQPRQQRAGARGPVSVEGQLANLVCEPWNKKSSQSFQVTSESRQRYY